MARKIYIGSSSSSRNVSNIYVGISGKSRKVTKGYIGVAGSARMFYSPSQLGYMDVGTIVNVRVNEDGEERLDEWVIVQIGKPNSSKYDSTSDGVWLMKRTGWKSSGTLRLEYPWFHDYGNWGWHLEDLYNIFSESVKSAIMNARFPSFTPVPDSSGAYDSTPGYWAISNVTARPMTLPSVPELTTDNNNYGWENQVATDGVILQLFETLEDVTSIFSFNWRSCTTRSHVMRKAWDGSYLPQEAVWECSHSTSGGKLFLQSSIGTSSSPQYLNPIIVVKPDTT